MTLHTPPDLLVGTLLFLEIGETNAHESDAERTLLPDVLLQEVPRQSEDVLEGVHVARDGRGPGPRLKVHCFVLQSHCSALEWKGILGYKEC